MVRKLDQFALDWRELTGGEASDDANGFGATGPDFGSGSAQNQPILNEVRYVLSGFRQRSRIKSPKILTGGLLLLG